MTTGQTRRERVRVQGPVLEWARRTAGLSLLQAADRLRIPETRLTALEAGRELPTRTLLGQMARLYKRAYTVMLLPEPPAIEEVPTDYRTLPGPRQAIGPDTAYALREARRLQEAITDIVSEEPRLYPTFVPVGASLDDAESAGSDFRASLGISVAYQTRWSDGAAAFRAWRGALQAVGIIALVEDMPREECRGFSLWNAELIPTVVVTRNEALVAQIFTLFHEVGHILLRSDAMCLKQEEDNLLGSIEAWCNRFAAAVLVPRDEFARYLDSRGIQEQREWPIEVLAGIAHRYKVSRHVIAIRLQDLGRALGDYYRRVRSELEIDDVREAPTPRPDAQEERRRNMAVERLAEVGFGAAGVILQACKGALLSTSEAADLLRLRPSNFGRLETLALRQRTRYGSA